MIALTGKKNIKVAKYALFGSKKLSNNILNAIKGSNSCLISNHGQISLGSPFPNSILQMTFINQLFQSRSKKNSEKKTNQ